MQERQTENTKENFELSKDSLEGEIVFPQNADSMISSYPLNFQRMSFHVFDNGRLKDFVDLHVGINRVFLDLFVKPFFKTNASLNSHDLLNPQAVYKEKKLAVNTVNVISRTVNTSGLWKYEFDEPRRSKESNRDFIREYKPEGNDHRGPEEWDSEDREKASLV